MKIIVDQNSLEQALGHLNNVVLSRTPTPVLGCVLLEASGGVLKLSATDLEAELRLELNTVDISDEGSALIRADKLLQITKACSTEETLKLHKNGNNLHIRGGQSQFKVFGFPSEEAASLEVASETNPDCTIDAISLKTMIKRTLFAAASDHTRFAINGGLFERSKNKIRLVATDGRRLSITSGSGEGGDGNQIKIIPTKTLVLVSKLIEQSEMVNVFFSDTQVKFEMTFGGGPAQLVSALVEGTFPPFDDVIPKEHLHKVSFNVELLRSAIRKAALLTNDESRGVRFRFTDGNLSLTSRAPEMGEAEVNTPIEYSGDDFEIGFNPDYVTDALRDLDTDEITLDLLAPNKPGVFKSGPGFTYVVMPVNLN